MTQFKGPEFNRRKKKVAPIYTALNAVYGDLKWDASRAYPPVDELVDCILSQSTNDANRDRAFQALKDTFPNWEAVADAPTEAVIDAIRPSGLANQKGPRIQAVLRRIRDERGEINIDFLADLPLEEARDWLTSFDGVGPKTAAIVLCFAFNRPAFPVDTHVHRVGQRLGLLPEGISADKAHPLMEAMVAPDQHYSFHLYLIKHGRDTCTARRAFCERCPITQHCDYFQRVEQSIKPVKANKPDKKSK